MSLTRWWWTSAVVLAAALPAAAQTGTRAGKIIPPFDTGSGSYIVEFRDPPLFARVAASSAALMSERFAAFDRDLARIAHQQTRIASDAAEAESPRITQRYSRVFAGAAVAASPDAIRRIAALDYVRSVHLDVPMHALLDDSLAKINAPQVWSTFGIRGDGIVVAIIDTGIDYNHPAFGGGFGPGHRVAGGWDFVNNDADPMDDAGHGTHVAGIVGGNGGGVTGVAPGVTFLAYKVLDSRGSGDESVILAAVERATDPNGDGNPSDHADVANMSLGGLALPNDPLAQAVETATAAGVTFAIAAGNSGDFWTVSSPAVAPSAIAVGATTIDDQIATFSSKGPDENMQIKPEVVAPGVNILSAKAGGGTLSESGTSMATPHVAGVAALLRALHRDWTPADVKAAIVETSVTLGNDVMAEGAGRVDALRAAGATLLALPSTIAFGRDQSSLAHWTSTQTLTIVNRGTAAQTLTLHASSSRAEAAAALDTTTLALKPGESRDVHVKLDVDNAALPVPLEGSLAFSGTITIDGGAAPIHLPWAFVRAAQVRLDYDGDEPYEAYVSSTTSATYAHIVTDQHEAIAAIPAGEYDVKLMTLAPRTIDHRLIVVERQKIDDALTIPIHRDSAANEIVFAPTAPDGRSIHDAIGGTGSCQDDLVLLWPDGAALSMSSMPKSLIEHQFVSAMSDRFTLLPMQFCFSTVTHKVYAAETTPLHGIASPVTASVDPSLWTRAPVHIALPPAAKSSVLSTGFLWRGTNWYFSYSIGAPAPVTDTSWNGEIFITREQHPSLNPTAKVEIDEAGTPPAIPRTLLSTGYVRSTDQGLTLWPFLTNSPVTYFLPAGNQLSFGDGPAVPLSAIWLEDGNLLAGVRFVGGLDEERDADGYAAKKVLRDAAGNEVSTEALAPGAYTFEVTGPLSLFNVAGELRLVAAFDTRRDDGVPPTLTALRVLDADGRVTSRLKPNSNATLTFSALDRNTKLNGIEYRLLRADATTVRWRVHGSTQWNSLPVTIAGNDLANGQDGFDALGHIPVGTVFQADLSSATYFGTNLIDLAVHVEDDGGNALDYSVSPAFSVSVRGRAAK